MKRKRELISGNDLLELSYQSKRLLNPPSKRIKHDRSSLTYLFNKSFRTRNRIPFGLKIVIVFLRYGTLDNSRLVNIRSLNNVQALTGVKCNTIKSIVRNFKLNGMESFQRRQRPGPKSKFTKDQLDYLTSSDVLKQQTGLSLKKRCVLYHRKYPYSKLSVASLHRIYRSNKISYR